MVIRPPDCYEHDRRELDIMAMDKVRMETLEYFKLIKIQMTYRHNTTYNRLNGVGWHTQRCKVCHQIKGEIGHKYKLSNRDYALTSDESGYMMMNIN